MDETLSSLTSEYSSLAIIGMCKNAGKTTVLNQIISELDRKTVTLGMTSIGRDGESSDLVTGTKKPGIYIRRGTIIATAEQLLRLSDISREILCTTGISTPMGEVVILRAQSDGHIQLAGPSMTYQLAEVSKLFTGFGAQKVIIDGAISRKTLCSRSVAEATVLCTGASYNKNIDVVVQDTAHICEVLTTKAITNTAVKNAAARAKSRILLIREDGEGLAVENMSIDDALRGKHIKEPKYIYIDGAMSEGMMKPLLMSNAALKGMVFVVRDGSKILLKQQTYEKIGIKGACLGVLDEINLAAVTINPFSAYGFHFDKFEFKEKMQSCIDLPVIDVGEEQGL